MRSSIFIAVAIALTLAPAVAGAADKPTDPQIAHIAYTAGDLDIKAAKQALEISKNAQVRAFADNMVKDHTAVNDKALALVKKLKVTPEDNATSKSLVEEDQISLASELLQVASERGVRLLLPVDHVIADDVKGTAPGTSSGAVPAGKVGLDVGKQSVEAFRTVIAEAKTIFWNGPLGMFEVPPFDAGTMAIAAAVADSSAISVIGGGDSVAAVMRSGRAADITHISTGGGASLEFLEGRPLPGLVALGGA